MEFMDNNETPTTERDTMITDKFKPWPTPAPAVTTQVEDFGNGIFINWKI